MKHSTTLRIVSLLTLLLLSLHFTDDIVRGISPAGRDNLAAVPIMVVLLIGPVLLSERKSGYIIMLLGGLFAAGMPVLHMLGRSYPEIAKSDGGFFFVWTLIAVGASGVLTVVLSSYALRTSRTR